MLKLLSRQALKTLRSPFRKSLPNPLRVPLQTRHLHNEPAPFSGPPSHATLARPFSASNPNPRRFFAQKATKEDVDRGNFPDYDVLDTDTYDDMIHSEISKLVGIPYLKEATKDEAGKVVRELDGFLYGRKLRMIFPCVLSIDDKARWVFFLVHSGSPLTYISAQVAQAFGLNEHENPWSAKIAGHPRPVHMSPSDSLFSNVNLLGADFSCMNGFGYCYNDNHPTITYYIGTKWEVNRKQR